MRLLCVAVAGSKYALRVHLNKPSPSHCTTLDRHLPTINILHHFPFTFQCSTDIAIWAARPTVPIIPLSLRCRLQPFLLHANQRQEVKLEETSWLTLMAITNRLPVNKTTLLVPRTIRANTFTPPTGRVGWRTLGVLYRCP